MATVLEGSGTRPSDVPPPRLAAWTPVELAARFGAIPMERLRHNREWGRATEADVVALEARGEKSLCELIDGVLVEKAMGSRESQIAYRLILKIGAEPPVFGETERFAAGAILPGLEFTVGELFAAR